MLLHPVEHGKQPENGLLAVCALKKSFKGNSYWANLNETCRLFLFPKSEWADLAILNIGTGKFTTLCKLKENKEGWQGVFGWLYYQIKSTGITKGPPYVLYYSKNYKSG